MTHWKTPWCWEGLGAREGDDRGWDVWMTSPTQWTWVWVNSGSWWWTGRTGVLRFAGLQRVRYDWATEMNWTELKLVWLVQQQATVSRSKNSFTQSQFCVKSIPLAYSGHIEFLLDRTQTISAPGILNISVVIILKFTCTYALLVGV